MADPIKKYLVKMTQNVAHPGRGEIHTLNCGELTAGEIQTYLRELQGIKTIPDGSCFHYMEAHFNKQDQSEITLSAGITRKPATLKNQSNGELTITIVMGNKCKCPKRDCFGNLQNGLCTDDTMKGLIGTKFFAENYSNTK